ncbi:podocin [Gouania willdenowi]|uniref:podocin n=1 Tax=Gouania willdenowi TaxID=441366 RepID=UPI00105620C6|nr:podocin-like [Gouania willdenowi]
MENSSDVQPKHSPLQRENGKEATVHQRERHQRQRGHRSDRLQERSSRKPRRDKEKPTMNEVKAGQEAVKLKVTVVDIDSVRDDHVKDETVGLLEAADPEDGLKHKSLGVFEWLLMVFVLVLVLSFLPFSIWFCIKVVREHERAVVFRLGHLLRGKPRGPGLLFYLPFLDVSHKVDIRLKMLKVPTHVVVTKDMLRPELSAVCYYQIENVALCITSLFSISSVLQSLVQAAVREVSAQHTCSHMLLQRRRTGEQVQVAVDAVACRWGIRVKRVDIDELSFPVELQQSVAAAEAETRIRQEARVKAAESEMVAWDGLRASIRRLQPALVLPLPPDLLNLNSDLPTPPPPPPPVPLLEEREDMTMGESERDSPMM